MSTTNIPHYVWIDNPLDEDPHFIACKSNGQACITISKHKKGYVYISYDTLYLSIELQLSDLDQIISLYKSYADLFNLPDKKREAAGGVNAFGFAVKHEHAEFIAEALFHFFEHKRQKANS